MQFTQLIQTVVLIKYTSDVCNNKAIKLLNN